MSIPENAEKFGVLDWLVAVKAPSRFVPGQQAITSKLQCPACAALHEREIDTTITCRCGLSMQYDMVHLHVWRDEVPAPRENMRNTLREVSKSELLR